MRRPHASDPEKGSVSGPFGRNLGAGSRFRRRLMADSPISHRSDREARSHERAERRRPAGGRPRAVPTGAGEAAPLRRAGAVPAAGRRLRGVRPRPVGRARLHPGPRRRGAAGGDRGRRVRRDADRRQPHPAGHPRLPDRREGRRLRRHLVLEPLPRVHVRRRVVHLHAAARRDRVHAHHEVRRRRRRSSSTASGSAVGSTSTRTRCSRPRSPPPNGTTTRRGGRSPRPGTIDSGPASS